MHTANFCYTSCGKNSNTWQIGEMFLFLQEDAYNVMWERKTCIVSSLPP